MKKKGFTLIELLAVIVILAIIALIAVPVIMNIISESRKSAFKDTAYGLISAGEMYYAESLLGDGMTEEATFTFTDGAVSPSGLNVKGSLPKSGSMKITTEGKIALAITNGELCITKDYDKSEIETTDEFESCELSSDEPKVNTLKDLARTNTFATSVAECATSGDCAVGTKFAIEVAPDNIQNFYVVSDADNKVTLLMDRNLGNMVAWGTSQASGPLTAIEYLENQTAGWTNIPAFDYTYVDDNTTKAYTDITRVGIRSRLLTKTEGSAIVANDWAYANFSSVYAYWLSTASADSIGNALLLTEKPSGGSVDEEAISESNYAGVRPVIEISK